MGRPTESGSGNRTGQPKWSHGRAEIMHEPEEKRVGKRVAIRCSADWATWLAGLCCFVECEQSTVIAQSLYRYSESVGYHVRRPPRLIRSPGSHRPPPEVRAAFDDQGRFESSTGFRYHREPTEPTEPALAVLDGLETARPAPDPDHNLNPPEDRLEPELHQVAEVEPKARRRNPELPGDLGREQDLKPDGLPVDPPRRRRTVRPPA